MEVNASVLTINYRDQHREKFLLLIHKVDMLTFWMVWPIQYLLLKSPKENLPSNRQL